MKFSSLSLPLHSKKKETFLTRNLRNSYKKDLGEGIHSQTCLFPELRHKTVGWVDGWMAENSF